MASTSDWITIEKRRGPRGLPCWTPSLERRTSEPNHWKGASLMRITLPMTELTTPSGIWFQNKRRASIYTNFTYVYTFFVFICCCCVVLTWCAPTIAFLQFPPPLKLGKNILTNIISTKQYYIFNKTSPKCGWLSKYSMILTVHEFKMLGMSFNLVISAAERVNEDIDTCWEASDEASWNSGSNASPCTVTPA